MNPSHILPSPPLGSAASTAAKRLFKGSLSNLPLVALATAYCVALIHAAGFKYLLFGALLYAPGAALYFVARNQRGQRPFTWAEYGLLGLLQTLALIAAWLVATQHVSL